MDGFRAVVQLATAIQEQTANHRGNYRPAYRYGNNYSYGVYHYNPNNSAHGGYNYSPYNFTRNRNHLDFDAGDHHNDQLREHRNVHHGNSGYYRDGNYRNVHYENPNENYRNVNRLNSHRCYGDNYRNEYGSGDNSRSNEFLCE